VDEQTVREHAQAHGDATVAGDLKRAGGDLTPEAMAQAPGVMGEMPRSLTGAEIASLIAEGDEFVAVIRYIAAGGEAVVESRWAERDGRPKIVNLRTLEAG
jgi:hypothetical protein